MSSLIASDQTSLRALYALPDDMLYLDSAAHGPPLKSVRAAGIAALRHSTTSWLGSAHWRDDVERVRRLAARLFDDNADAVAMIPSAAYGLSVAARNVPLQPNQSVLVLEGQFPSNLLPWRQRCADVGASLVFARREEGQGWTAAVLDALDAHPEIRVLALPQAHWRDGSLLDLGRIADRARARGARLVLDLSQSLGAMPVDLKAWQPDFVVAVGYKWLLGGYGLAWLWAAPHWREHGQPIEHGWMANDNDALWQPGSRGDVRHLPGARRFDAGGVCDAMRLAMAEAALGQILDWGVAHIAKQLQRRTTALDDALEAHGLGGLRTLDHVPHICGVKLPPQRAEAVARALSDAHIVTTVRNGCVRIAPHLHLGIGEMVRPIEVIAEWLLRRKG
ncbi:MAG: aminotransferase class V-fold PLP-dependent enzyme [Pseudomonadota bacterium]|nr:aminotransferase class V-fold PLP-dependent enzyme [Pseudomonadota bacterium]